MDLDHVALAATDAGPALATLVGELGGLVLSGGQSRGFRPVQVRLGDATHGMTVELLEPWDVQHNDFLARFLARHGDGPHHLTVKVDDFDAALDAVRASGRSPVGVNRQDPNWMEAFLVPAEACGTVVQLAAQADPGDFASRFAAVEAHGPLASPVWWRALPPRAPTAVELCRVVLRTPDRLEARRFFGELLGGEEASSGAVTTELVWPGGARLCLEDHDGPPGIDRLELAGAARERRVAGTRVVGS
ncbi:MAG TPA: VOC family protein [Acidimicrobiia bacterium]|nr:VOC family protein [Acidimicrobiia bacterium]